MKYPIGIQDFEQIIEGDYVYLDKTALVYDLVTNGKIYFLCRHRRVGKSLLVSTLKCYFEGKEEMAVVNTITENSQIDVLCLLDTDAQRIERCEKALNEKLMELSAQTGQFYRGTLRRGDTLESESSIIVIGDVEHGARITAKGNVIVLGELKGSVTAGVSGNAQAVVMAFSMMPFQLRIGNCPIPTNEKHRRFGRGAMIACIRDGEIAFQPVKGRSIFGDMG